MRSSYKKLGQFIQEVNIRNKDLGVERLLGVSIRKVLMPSIANTIGTDMKTYKIIKRNQFAYGPVTSRNGDKISIALLEDFDEAIISQAYVVFEVIDETQLLPEYAMMWFRRPEFDRYARFKSYGSARETFDWNELCDTELPIPSMEEQREIVAEYNTITNRITLNEQLNQKLEETAQALYKHWFVDFEFPIHCHSERSEESHINTDYSKGYKSSGGEMVYNEELDGEIPLGWEVRNLSDLSKLITKGTTPRKMYSNFIKGKIPYIKAQSIGSNHFINPLKTDFIDVDDHRKELKRSIIIEDDLLFTITGTLGEFALVDKEIKEANTNQNVAIIRFKEKRIHPRFIVFLLMGNWHKDFLLENTQEAVQANLNLSMIGNMKIILPPKRYLEIIIKPIDVIIEQKYNLHKQNNRLLLFEQLILSRMSKEEVLLE
ncbi:restriction endonuclease subunit S [Bizionia arctica]|uniref:Type I restriction modification DNA specificity domain-containing protein n=1 Tax=Bizionia arctica TaxID=1495645 RepID=A0A917GDR7_9FLAO|nr:restriction endonuclease subunit S [Bizionia arctica]GGG40558.1 hypothetical protein GCM10010976_10250 [Bizionia arctica]